MLGLKLSNNGFDVSPCMWLIFIGILLCPPLWLGSPKDMKYVQIHNQDFKLNIFYWFKYLIDT